MFVASDNFYTNLSTVSVCFTSILVINLKHRSNTLSSIPYSQLSPAYTVLRCYILYFKCVYFYTMSFYLTKKMYTLAMPSCSLQPTMQNC